MTNVSETHAAIDEVARQLTTGPAPASLRASVLARLEERPAPAWWREPRMALAAALVVVVVSGATIMQLRESGARPSAPVIAAIPPPAPTAPPTALPAPVTPSVQAAAAPVTPSEGELAWRARALPALQIPAAMTFEEIQPDPLVIPLLDVTPIVMSPIALPSDGGGSR